MRSEKRREEIHCRVTGQNGYLSVEEARHRLTAGSPVLLGEEFNHDVITKAILHMYGLPDDTKVTLIPKFGFCRPPANALVSKIPIFHATQQDHTKVPVLLQSL